MKTITFLDGSEFRRQVLKGIKDLATITAQTLGPGGRAILLEQENGSVLATKDGVTVAQHFAANSPVERLVAKAAVEASERTVRTCGDGTTSSLVLASAIVEAGHDWLQKNPGHSPQALSRALKDELNDRIVPAVTALARPIKGLPYDEAQKAIWHVANVSANFDKEIADAVTEAVTLVGDDGMVQCEEGAGGQTVIKKESGFPVIGRGLRDLGGSAAAAFVNRKDYGDCIVNDAHIALYDGDINDVDSILPMIENLRKEMDAQGNYTHRPIVVVAHAFSDNVMKLLATNFRQNKVTIVPFLTAYNGQSLGRQGFLHDLAAYTGGTVFEPQGNPLANCTPTTAGYVSEVKIGASDSVFLVELNSEKAKEHQAELIEKRIGELKTQMNGQSQFDQDRLRYRIGQLTGGIATIYAGGATALEAKERRDRVVDAVSAVRSAMELGVVPGGGSALLEITRSLPNAGPSQILKKALLRPFIQILLNAGVASNEQEALNLGNDVGFAEDGQFYVFDALKKERVEFWKSGIFDGGKTVTHALQNALSVAQLLMTTGGAIAYSLSDGEDQAKAFQKALAALSNGETQ